MKHEAVALMDRSKPLLLQAGGLRFAAGAAVATANHGSEGQGGCTQLQEASPTNARLRPRGVTWHKRRNNALNGHVEV